MGNIITFTAPYLNIFVKSYLICTQHYNIFIDSALNSQAGTLLPYLQNGKETILLMTHGHWDHIGLNRVIHDHGGTICAHPADLPFFQDFFWHWKLGFGQFEKTIAVPPERRETFWREIGEPAPVDRYLKEGEKLTFDDVSLRVVGLPGHSRGSLGFYDEDADVLFTGDALMGRGFFGGMAQYCDYRSYVDSMNKIAALAPKTIYTAHTDPYENGLGAAAALDAIDFAGRVKADVEAYVCMAQGPLCLRDAAAFICGRAGRNMGGGACVTALNHLHDLQETDDRCAHFAKAYICGM